MNKKIEIQVRELSKVNRVPFEVMMAIIEVETPGNGFDTKTGKILIQFEPSWFKKNSPSLLKRYEKISLELKNPEVKVNAIDKTFYTNYETVIGNKVDVQNKEWIAFNTAFFMDKEAAMKSTSIGLPQIMGFHLERLGYKTVGDMWDDFKKGEYQQVLALFRFVLTDAKLLKAVREKNYHMIAYIYNGSAYKEMAKKWGRESYDISLRKASEKWFLKR